MLNENHLRTARELLCSLETLEYELTTTHLRVLLYVALHPGCKLADIVRDAGISQSAVSRAAALLGNGRKEVPGHNLVLAQEDRMDRRVRMTSLTPEGMRVVRDMTAVFDNASRDVVVVVEPKKEEARRFVPLRATTQAKEELRRKFTIIQPEGIYGGKTPQGD